jgi:hypothetical protein
MKSITLSEVFKKNNEVFKAVFPPLAVFFLIFGVLPGALMNTYMKGKFLMIFAGMLMLVFCSAVHILFIKAFFEDKVAELLPAAAELKNWFLPALSSLFLFVGAYFVFSIILIILLVVTLTVTGVASGVSDPQLLMRSPAGIISFAAVMAVFVLFFVFVAVRFAFVFNFIVAEGAAWFEPFKKSWKLTKGYMWKIVLLRLPSILVMSLAFAVQSSANSLPFFTAMLAVMPVTFYIATLLHTLFFELYYNK